MKTLLFLLTLFIGTLTYAQVSSASQGEKSDSFIQFGDDQVELSVYPNPAVSYAKVKVNQNAKVRIEEVSIFSILGNQVFSKEYNKEQMVQINVQNLKKGRYMLRVLLSDKSSKVVSIVKS